MSDLYDKINLLEQEAFAHALVSGKDIYVLALDELYVYENEKYATQWLIVGDKSKAVADKVSALNTLNATMGEALREEGEKGFTFDELLAIVQDDNAVLCVTAREHFYSDDYYSAFDEHCGFLAKITNEHLTSFLQNSFYYYAGVASVADYQKLIARMNKLPARALTALKDHTKPFYCAHTLLFESMGFCLETDNFETGCYTGLNVNIARSLHNKTEVVDIAFQLNLYAKHTEDILRATICLDMADLEFLFKNFSLPE